jgi:hypothetical protein
MDDSLKQIYQMADDMDLVDGTLQLVLFVCLCSSDTPGGELTT